MKYFFHAFVVVGVFVGGDMYANEGRETQKFVRDLNLRGTFEQAKLQSYHASASIRQQVYGASPQLAAAKLHH